MTATMATLAPIVLNRYGERMLEPVLRHAPDYHRDDETHLYHGGYPEHTIVGIHQNCGGNIQLVRISPSHNALACVHTNIDARVPPRGCNLRIVIPSEIMTYGELREELQKQFNR